MEQHIYEQLWSRREVARALIYQRCVEKILTSVLQIFHLCVHTVDKRGHIQPAVRCRQQMHFG